MNDEFTWEDQVSKVCLNVLFTLKRLWTMSTFMPMETRHKLVTSLIVPQFLYCDVIFSNSTVRLRERLKVVFNSCTKYIYGISRYEHITQYANRILGSPLEKFYSFRVCCTMNNIIKTGCPRYLFSEIQCGQTSRMFNIIIPFHRSNRICLLRSSILSANIPHTFLALPYLEESDITEMESLCIERFDIEEVNIKNTDFFCVLQSQRGLQI
jgi:hypothetical protein